MRMLKSLRDQLKRVKGAEWAVLLLVLGLAGSLLLSSGQTLFGSAPGETADASADALEARLSRVLSSMEGAGAVEVVIHYAKPVAAQTNWLGSTANEETQEPIGALIIAQGAGDLQVRLELLRAVETLLQLDAGSVEILKMDAQKGGK